MLLIGIRCLNIVFYAGFLCISCFGLLPLRGSGEIKIKILMREGRMRVKPSEYVQSTIEELRFFVSFF